MASAYASVRLLLMQPLQKTNAVIQSDLTASALTFPVFGRVLFNHIPRQQTQVTADWGTELITVVYVELHISKTLDGIREIPLRLSLDLCINKSRLSTLFVP